MNLQPLLQRSVAEAISTLDAEANANVQAVRIIDRLEQQGVIEAESKADEAKRLLVVDADGEGPVIVRFALKNMIGELLAFVGTIYGSSGNPVVIGLGAGALLVAAWNKSRTPLSVLDGNILVHIYLNRDEVSGSRSTEAVASDLERDTQDVEQALLRLKEMGVVDHEEDAWTVKEKIRLRF